jgi:hypothetical protein
VLVLDGEFDQATPVADARRAASHWHDSTYVQVQDTAHISALADFQGCATGIVRRFLSRIAAGDTSCAGRVPGVEVARFPRRLGLAPGSGAADRAAWTAAATVGDAFARWYNLMYGVHGYGLRGGRFSVAGGYYSHRPLRIKFAGDRFVSNLAVSGAATWTRTARSVRADLSLRGPAAASGRIVLVFATGGPHARATVTGTLGGRRVHVALASPWTPQG